MVFRGAGPAPRHPSQIYQFLLEGLLLFVLLWLYARKPRRTGQVSAAFLIGYGVLRFIAEYFREPDDFLGLLALNLSMGQWLCLPMIVGGRGPVVVGEHAGRVRPDPALRGRALSSGLGLTVRLTRVRVFPDLIIMCNYIKL